MIILRTQLATDFREPSSWWGRLLSIDTANPGYRGKLHLVRSWLVEFDKAGIPLREIGLDEQGSVVLAGPGEKHCGFWLDTNMRKQDFEGEPASAQYFEELWAAFASR